MIKKSLLLKAVLLLLPASFANAQVSPDGKLQVTVKCEGGNPVYTVTYNGNQCMKASPLGLNTNIGDFTKGLSLTATPPAPDPHFTETETVSFGGHELWEALPLRIGMEVELSPLWL